MALKNYFAYCGFPVSVRLHGIITQNDMNLHENLNYFQKLTIFKTNELPFIKNSLVCLQRKQEELKVSLTPCDNGRSSEIRTDIRCSRTWKRGCNSFRNSPVFKYF
jgi:hypothetical protein